MDDVEIRPAPSRPTGESVLVERDEELAVLDRLLADALAGEPVLAFVEGPAGIGKSRLLAAAREKAGAAGVRVLAARGSDLERELPFGVVRQLFDPLLADPEARERWLTGSARPAARVFAPPDEADAAGDVSFGILVGLFWLTANVATDGPLMLAIDDLHWCDPASLRFIAYLERRLEGLQVLVVTASRMGEPDADTRLIEEIAHDQAAVPLRPQALSDAGVAELVRERLGADAEPAFVAACRRATAGNPLLLRELLKTLASEGVEPGAVDADVIRDIGPRAVSRTVLLRLARLPAGAIAVARAVAVLGDGAGLPATAILAALDEPSAAEAVAALVGAEILRPEAPLGFVHPLVRDAIYHELAPSQRELQHERAAKALIDLGAAPEHVAAHLLVVPCRAEPWVADLLRDAARAARRRGVAESAVAYLRRALAEPAPEAERTALLLELGMAEALLNVPASVEHLGEAHAQLTDPLERARAGDLLARMLLFTRPPQEAVAVARNTIADLPAGSADERRALEAFELYAGVAFGADVPDAAARLASVRVGERAVGPGASMMLAVTAWDRALRGGTAPECADLALAALADGSLIAADPGFMAIVATTVLVLADRDEALDAWDAAMDEAHRLGSAFAVCGVDLWRGWTWLQRGELAEAEDALRRALEETVLVEEQDGAGMAYVTAFLARLLLETGDPAGARAAMSEPGRPTPYSDGDALLRRSRTELLLAKGRWADALAEAEGCRDRLRGADNPAWVPWRSLVALALEGLGRTGEAVALLEEELAVARSWGAPGALSRTLRLLGTLQGRNGLALLHEAVATAEGSPARLEHAKALAALGSTLRRERQPSEAREPLRLGLEIAGRCGARALADDVRTELHAAGGRPRREALSGPGSLTPSERRVAGLAADGQTNREIAQTLYVTPKTVEVHLTSVYRKLGISARAALAAALAA